MDPFLIFISVTNMESIGGTFRNLFRWQQDQQQVNIMVLGMCYCCLRKLQHYWIITPYNKMATKLEGITLRTISRVFFSIESCSLLYDCWEANAGVDAGLVKHTHMHQSSHNKPVHDSGYHSI